MVRLFRSQYLIQYILLFLLTVVLWSDALLFPGKLVTGEGFRHFPAIAAFVRNYPYLAIALSVIVLYLQALILNGIAENHRLVERNQLVTAAIYILMMSSQPQMAQPNIMLIVNFLLIVLLYKILNLYGKTEPLSDLFDTGLLAGLAAMLFYPALVFVPFVFLSLLTFRHYRWREWVVPVIGMITPWMFVAGYYFWFNELENKLSEFIAFFSFRVPDPGMVTTEVLAIWLLFLVLILTGLGKIFRYANESTLDIRRKSRVIFWLLLFGMSATFFSGFDLITQAYLEFIPIVIFLAMYVSRKKKLFMVELLFFVIFAAIVTIRILNLS